MKKLIGKRVVDVYAEACDLCEQICREEPNYMGLDLKVDFDFGYSSNLDGTRGKTQFCSVCSEKILNCLNSNFPSVVFAVDRDLIFTQEDYEELLAEGGELERSERSFSILELEDLS